MDRATTSPKRDNFADQSVIDHLARRVFVRAQRKPRAFSEAHGRVLEHAITQHCENARGGLPVF